MGSLHQGGGAFTVGRGGLGRDTRGDTHVEEREVGSNLCRDTKVIGFLDPCRMCVFSVRIFNIDAES